MENQTKWFESDNRHNKDRLLAGRTVMGWPFESICSLRTILSVPKANKVRFVSGEIRCAESHERKCLTKGIYGEATA